MYILYVLFSTNLYTADFTDSILNNSQRKCSYVCNVNIIKNFRSRFCMKNAVMNNIMIISRTYSCAYIRVLMNFVISSRLKLSLLCTLRNEFSPLDYCKCRICMHMIHSMHSARLLHMSKQC